MKIFIYCVYLCARVHYLRYCCYGIFKVFYGGLGSMRRGVMKRTRRCRSKDSALDDEAILQLRQKVEEGYYLRRDVSQYIVQNFIEKN